MNGRERTGTHHIDVLAALLLLCAFAMCILSVLMAGTRSYRSLTARDQAVFARTSRTLYISTRIHRAESRAAVSFGNEETADAAAGTIDTIRLSETIGGEEYVTRIYCYDGWIRELFSRADLRFDPRAGEKVSEAISMEVSSMEAASAAVNDDSEEAGKGPVMRVVIDGGTEDAETMYFSLKEGGR